MHLTALRTSGTDNPLAAKCHCPFPGRQGPNLVMKSSFHSAARDRVPFVALIYSIWVCLTGCWGPFLWVDVWPDIVEALLELDAR